MGASQLLFDRHGSQCKPGGKTDCPYCSHKTFSIKRDDTIGKCFHPSCGRFILPEGRDGGQVSVVQEPLRTVLADFHTALLDQQTLKDRCAYSYLVEERAIHPQVVADSMLGVIPVSYELDAAFRAAGAIESDDDQSKLLEEAKEKLRACVEGHAGWLCFFYTDQYHRFTSIKFRQPYSRDFLLFKPFEPTGLFGHGLFGVDQNQKARGPIDTLLVVEGEFNQLQLQSLLVRYSESTGENLDYVPACAVGGVTGADLETLSRISTKPIICYDNDSSNAGFQLVEKAREYINVIAFTTPEVDSDLDEYIRSFKDNHTSAWDGLKALLKDAQHYAKTFDGVARKVDDIRRGRGKVHVINGLSAKLILEDMAERGSLLWNPQAAYFQDKGSGEVIRIDAKSRECALYLDNYGINPTEPIFRFVVEHLAMKAFKHGDQASIYHTHHYDKDRLAVYLYDQDNRIVRVTSKGHDLVPNGTDGVLFLADRSAEPFHIGDTAAPSTLFRDLILNQINFASDRLSVGEKRLLFDLWHNSVFFDSIMKTRPILALVGDQGSGKSSSLRWIGLLLQGSAFDVTPLPHKSDDFDAAITNTDYLAIDNADTGRPWLEDRLAIVATGGTLKRRALYTTNELVDFPVRCALGITARTPRFRRPDVAQRLLVLTLNTLAPHQYRGESELVQEILQNRDALMTEQVGTIQQILKALESQSGYNGTGGIRMADFGNFAMKLGRHNGHEAGVAAVLKKLTREQSTFSLEDDIIYELLPQLLKENPDTEWSLSEMCDAMTDLAQRHGIEFMYRGKHRSFSQRVRNIKAALRQYYDISERTAKAGKTYYRFAFKTDQRDSEEQVLDHPTNPTHPQRLSQATGKQSLTTQGVLGDLGSN